MQKKITSSIFAVIVLLMVGLFLPHDVQSQVQAQDQAQMLEQIIDLPDLQQHYPLNAQGNQKQVHIMQFPVSFSSDISLSNSDREVVFMERSEIESKKVDAYFMIRSISEVQGTTKVVGHYFYNYNYDTKKGNYDAITVNFQKTGSEMKMVNANVKGGAL